jgi:hypothetical protein
MPRDTHGLHLPRISRVRGRLTVTRERRIIQITVQRQALGSTGEQRMATNRNEPDREEQNSPWLGVAKFLFIVFLAAMFFLLVRSMVGHHFFSGGQMNRHD